MSQNALFKSKRCCWIHERDSAICDPPTAFCEWVEKARQVVTFTYPSVDWQCQTPETAEAYRALIFCLEEHFLTPGSFMDLEGVREAWRVYYQSCLPF